MSDMGGGSNLVAAKIPYLLSFREFQLPVEQKAITLFGIESAELKWKTVITKRCSTSFLFAEAFPDGFDTKLILTESKPERTYNSHYDNGVPAMFTS